MYNYGKYPASVGAKLILFPNTSDVLCTDPDLTKKCTRRELEDNIGSTLVCVDTDDNVYAVPVKITVHASADDEDIVTVLTITETTVEAVTTTTIAVKDYTVKED